jgi:DNA-binding MarR family transcriptional regulator
MENGEVSTQRLMEAFYRMAKGRHALFQDLLHDFEVTPHQFHLLTYMQASGKVRVTDLSGMMLVSKPTASRMLNTLCEKGLAKKGADRCDRRLVYLQLTHKGQRVVEEVQARQKEILSRILEKMPEDKMRTFLETLERIIVELAAVSREDTEKGGMG